MAVNCYLKGSTLAILGKVLRLFSVICTLLLIVNCTEKHTPQLVSVTGATMGTWYTVKYLPPKAAELTFEQISTQIHARLDNVDTLMSTYKKDSEVSRFNQSEKNDWFPVSQETLDVVVLAQEISAQTQGAFDISVASLVRLWGFGPEYQQQKIPDADTVASMLEQVGFLNLEVDRRSGRLRKKSAISIDLSAIAKGFGVDQVAGYLDEIGTESYMVEVGGEIRAKGLKPGNAPWRIAIESPQVQSLGEKTDAERKVQKIINVVDVAVATSGDYRNYFEKDGQRYSHTIDPKTGYPITHNLASVTVLSDSAARADGLATAFSVMGAEKAMAFAARYNIAAYFIIKESDGFVALASDAFGKIPSGGL